MLGEMPFDQQLQGLRHALGIRSRKALFDKLRAKFGRTILTESQIKYLESPAAAAPEAEDLEKLCLFFLQESAFFGPINAISLCRSAGYIPVFTWDKDNKIVDVSLEPAKGDIAGLLKREVKRTSEKHPPTTVLDESASAWLKSVSENLVAIRPTASPSVLRLERRAQRLVRSEPRDTAAMNRILDELERIASSKRDLGDLFAAQQLIGRLSLEIHDYGRAIDSFETAYYIAKAFRSRGAPWALEALAQLCESAAKAYLSVGTKDDWDHAFLFLQQALGIRGQVKDELEEMGEERITATLQSMLELARYETNKRNLDEAERQYQRLLGMEELQKRPLIHASTEKELADNYRFAENLEGQQEHFNIARSLYEKIWASAEAEKDPVLKIEVALNIAYCLRRLDQEEEAIAWFHEALERAKRLGDRRRVAYSCLQLARSPVVQVKPVDACTYLYAAKRVFERTGAAGDLASAEALWRDLTLRITVEEDEAIPNLCRKARLSVFYE